MRTPALNQPTDPARIVESNDLGDYLRTHGYGDLLAAIDDPVVWCRRTGRLNKTALARKMGTTVHRLDGVWDRIKTLLGE